MKNPQYRYFIELQPKDGAPVSRALETESRRKVALEFLESVRDWLKKQDLSEKVSTLTVTMFGQIQITCEANVIKFIRHQNSMDIAAIRQGAMHSETVGRWNEAR